MVFLFTLAFSRDKLVTDTHTHPRVQLFCDVAPRACDNFLRHCKSGYYQGTLFHRLIPGFMVQGGDPTGTGTGGKSAFDQGLPFADEFSFTKTHSERGVLAMANSGPGTNRSQFYITFSSCPHLDRKHTVFGRVVGGMDALDRIEHVPADKGTKRPHEVGCRGALPFPPLGRCVCVPCC